jgi:uncharacterized HAD superfamily protein/hypoxanthine phosphoribosyltransferase
MTYFEYRSVEDLNQAIIKNLSVFPHDVDLIVGIPRSGMLPANLLALYLNKPYTDIDSFVEGRIYQAGARGKYINQENVHKVLVIDDYLVSGKAIVKAKEKLKHLSQQYDISYGVVYAGAANADMVHYCCEKVSYSLIFQWNIFLFPTLVSESCFDIDGVLCENPPVDDDGPVYLDYITSAKPLYLPGGEINTIVTCRLEKYRKATEEWLEKWHICYKNLVMLDLPTKEAREQWGKYGAYKGEMYKNSRCILFIESSLPEAVEINKVSGKPVFCTEIFDMIRKDAAYEKAKHKIKTSITAPFKKVLRKCSPQFYNRLKNILYKLK